jgi:hypothetical protein
MAADSFESAAISRLTTSERDQLMLLNMSRRATMRMEPPHP